MTHHPLIQRLIDGGGARAIDAANVDDFVDAPGDHVLFLAGDPVRFPECLDVAVVLPELRRACADAFDVGVVSRDDEDAIARRYGAIHWPALVFVRAGRYVTSVAGMQDWLPYVKSVRDALAAAPMRVPLGIPVVAAGGPACH